ncbi:MAG: SBBP repeat-containing protein, partial [Bacteroidales bacterium]|nr:SBBP repeat-containing protein [Bacteroidales bacterium]
YKNLYEGIDYIIYSHENQFKYDLVVSPNAKVSDIQMKYDGLDKISLSKGSLLIRTSINTIVELQPFAYQLIDGLEKEVVCDFVLNKNIVGFECPNYDPNFPLIIDPVMIFSTYTGSTSDNWGYTATYDKFGFFYSGGCSFGVGYPVTTGAYQVNYGGGGVNNVDVVITKFDTTGSFLIYSTFLGGTGTEVPHSLIVNDNNELYVLTSTGSANYPTTTSCYDNTFNGGTSYVLTYTLHYTNGADIAISKFSENGSQLLASTYFGGSGNDGLNTITALKKNYADDVRGEIMIDENSNVYVVSSTTSTNFPVTAGAFQQNHAGGTQDGVVFKFNHNLTNLIWSSYLGGNGDDACYSIQIDTENNVYVAGGTTSSNFPTTPGVVQPNQGGGVDGYITLINTNGNTILA